MLSQLSYIPEDRTGGPFWIRTRDLTVISRALSPTELKARGGAAAARPCGAQDRHGTHSAPRAALEKARTDAWCRVLDP